MCTENLTPWLKLLPCGLGPGSRRVDVGRRGRHRGLAALLSSLVLQVAESPLASLTLAVRHGLAVGRDWHQVGRGGCGASLSRRGAAGGREVVAQVVRRLQGRGGG